MKKTIYPLLLIALFFASGKTYGQTLRSAAEPDYPPVSIANADGSADGLAVELLKEALSAMGREASFKTAPWNQIKSELAAGELDVLPLVGRTPEREELYDFTVPYLTLHGALFVRDDDLRIASLADLPGKRIAVMTGDNAEEYVLRTKLSSQIISTTTFDDAFRLLAAGEADAVIAQKLMGVSLVKQLGIRNIKVVGRPNEEFKQDFCFAVKKGNAELLAELNEGLALVVANGTQRSLMSKWLGASEVVSARSRVLIYGDDPSYPPRMLLDEQGRPTGFHVELLQAMAIKTGLLVDFRPYPWKEVRRKMRDDELDITSMLYTPERDQLVDFSLPHSVEYAAVFTRVGAPSYQTDLKGCRIAVQNGDMLHEYALEQGWEETLTVTETLEDSLTLLANGQVDFALCYHIPGLQRIRKNSWKNIRTAEPRLMKTEYCFVVYEGNQPLLNLLNDGLRELKETGEYQTIYNKWLGGFDETKRPLPLWFWMVVCGAGGTAVLLFGANRLLRHQVNRRTAELRQSEARFEIAADAANIGIWDRDIVLDQLTWDARMSAIYGIRIEDFGGAYEAWQSCVHPDDLERASAEVDAAETGKKPFDSTFRIIRPDGEVRQVRACAKVIHAKDGTPLRMTGTNQDITEQFDNEARYKMLFSSMQSGVAVFRPVDNNRDFVFVDMNPAGLKYSRITREQILDRKVTEVFPGIGSSGLLAGLRRVAETGKPEHLPLTHYQDNRIDQYVENQVFQLASGLVVAVFHDITERKKAELKLKESEEKLRARNRELERFNKASVDRELRMIELKREINALCRKLEQKEPYSLYSGGEE
jgi:two-component system sensor histidine kinase EvgS